MPKRERDANTEAAELVAKVTETRKPRASELLGSPELRRKLAAAKAADKARQKPRR